VPSAALGSAPIHRASGCEVRVQRCVRRGSRLDDFQVYGCHLAVTAGFCLEGNLLVFIKLAQPGLFDGADMHEHIVASTLWLDEAETFLRIEPLHCSTLGHGDVLLVEMLNEHGYRDIAGLSRNCSAVLTWQ